MLSLTHSISFFLRRYYPKTSVPMATLYDPVRFRTIGGTYKWAPMFLNRIAKVYGVAWVKQRLSQWRWSLSTAFTGVGCAENV